MSKFIAWIRAHTWESVSAVLGVALVVVSVLLIGNSGVETTGEAVGSTTTSIEVGPTTTVDSATATTGGGDDGATGTTEPEEVEIIEGVTAVVVDNVQDVGFQIGLNAADLIIETPVEGGLSRFTALYGTEVPRLIGPVRSLRPVSADLLAPFTPVVFTSGGQRFVLGAVSSTGSVIITPDDSIAFQSLERPRPHHLFVSPGEDVPSGLEVVPPWEVGEWVGGNPATNVEVPVSGGVTWQFENGAYTRYVGGEPQQVLAEFDGEPAPLTRDTLILLYANEKSAGYTDSAGAEVPTFDVVGGGSLAVYHQGEVIEGTWSRASQATSYEFSTTDGATLVIPSGATYFVVIPDDAG